MEITSTAKVPLYPTPEHGELFAETLEVCHQGCNGVSAIVDATHCVHQATLHTGSHRPLRTQFGLHSQMAQSVIKTVIARYKGVLAHVNPWTRVQFAAPALDSLRKRDYYLKVGQLSVNTPGGCVPVSFALRGMEQFFDDAWQFCTVHLVHRHSRWFLHEPMTKDVIGTDWAKIRQALGLDFRTNFPVTAYDSQGQTTFFPGRAVIGRTMIRLA